MNADYMKYAKELSDIGEKIINVGQKLPSTDNKTKEEVESIFKEYFDAVCLYKGFLKGLTEITPPKIIQNEHREIINTFQIFIQGTDIFSQALDFKNSIIDKEKIKLGRDMIEQGEKRITKLTSKISLKLTLN